jgi:hypothetical protein
MKNNADIADATSASYTTPATVLADDGALFSVKVANSNGSITSATAKLTVNAAAVGVTITTQPASQIVSVGATATFSVVANGTAPLTYQWQKNSVDIVGATMANYTTPPTVIGDSGGMYRVKITNSVNSVTSNAATLTVNAVATGPAIVTQPTNQTVVEGATATFSVVANGTAPLSYQWQKNNTDISGATAASYTTPATVIGDNSATYRVKVTNSVASATSNSATLAVTAARSAPSITTQPTNQSVFVGSTATFTVVASGTPTPTYQWQKNNVDIAGATSSSYTTPAVVIGDNTATFRVKVTNSVNSVTSNTAVLTVTQAPPPGDAAPMGVNLDFLTDYSASQMLADVVKSSRVFSKAGQPQGTGANPQLRATTDADGWPTEDFSFYLWAGSSNMQMAGTYKGRFNGQANVSAQGVTISNKVYDSATNTTTFDLIATNASTFVVMNFSNTGGTVKNLQIMRPGHAFTEMWNRDFIALIQPFPLVRTMDATNTNDNPETTWADRRKLTDAQWAPDLYKQTATSGSGLPWEAIISLANTANKDIWINIPVKADDDYVRNLATLMANTLDPSHKVYLEYSNEVWNGQFSQMHWNVTQAQADVAAGDADLSWNGESNQYYLAQRRVAKRIIQIGNIFKDAMGPSSFGTRYRPVYATQIGNSGYAPNVLAMVNARFGPPKNFLYAVAGAPYITARNDTTTDAIFTDLNAFNAATEYTYSDFVTTVTRYQLPMIAYEGGPDMESSSTSAIATANGDPRMEAVTYNLLKQWFDTSSGNFKTFVWFAISSANWSDSWGITDWVTKTDTPKMRAIKRIINEYPNP